jgi:hypothetical protein
MLLAMAPSAIGYTAAVLATKTCSTLPFCAGVQHIDGAVDVDVRGFGRVLLQYGMKWMAAKCSTHVRARGVDPRPAGLAVTDVGLEETVIGTPAR